MNNSKNFFTTLIYLGLRAGVILFSAALLFDFGRDPGFSEKTWNLIIQILFGVLFLLIVTVCISTSKTRFDSAAFFFVLLGSILKVLMIFINGGPILEAPIFLLLTAVAFYFMTKSQRTHKKKTIAFYHE